MLGPDATWLLFMLLAMIPVTWAYFKVRPDYAVGIGAALSLLAPTWVGVGNEPFVLDVRLAITCVTLLAYCFHPLGTLRYPQHWLDGVVLAIILVHVVSDTVHGTPVHLALLRAIGEWTVPYLAGRCSVLFQGGVTRLSPWFCVVAIVLSLGALVEAMLGVNPWELLFTPVDDLVVRSREMRYDWIYRAAGPTRHPLFLAIILMLLIPWATAQCERGDSLWSKSLGWTALLGIVVGMVCTASRGPLLALAIAGFVASYLRFESARPYLAVGAVVCGLLLGIFAKQIPTFFEQSDTTRGRGRLVEVNDEARIYTGTRNRILVWEIYGPLVLKGGLFGFGTTAVSSFPPNIPGLPKSASSVDTLGIVDNSYLLFGLRFGLVGLILLLTLLFGAIINAISKRRVASLLFYPSGSAFTTALAAILIGVGFEIATVFLSYEFGYWILFTCGVSTGLASLNLRILRGAED